MLSSLFIFTVRGDRSLIIGGDRCSEGTGKQCRKFQEISTAHAATSTIIV
jgi:hypothetical protein